MLQPLWTEMASDSTPADPAAFATSIQHLLRTEPLRIVTVRSAAAASGSPLLGLAVLRVYNNTFNVTKAHLESIIVAADHRSRGIGTQLVNETKKLAAAAGAREIVSYPSTQQFEATRFFFNQRMTITDMYFNGSCTTKVDRSNGSNPANSPQSPMSPLSPSVAALAAAAAPFVATCIDPCNPSVSDLALLRAGENVHRQLRMKMPQGTEAYLARMKVIGADGAKVVVVAERNPAGAGAAADAASAVVSASPVALGVGVYRFYVDSVTRRLKCFVDDLITDSGRRSLGVGAALVDAIRADARSRGVESFQLDSGVHRHQAHKFYFREGMVIDRFSFGGPLELV